MGGGTRVFWGGDSGAIMQREGTGYERLELEQADSRVMKGP